MAQQNLPLSPNLIGNTDAHFNMKVKARVRCQKTFCCSVSPRSIPPTRLPSCHVLYLVVLLRFLTSCAIWRVLGRAVTKLEHQARADAAGNVTVKVTEMEKRNPAFGKDIPNDRWHRLDSRERTLETTVLEKSQGTDYLAWDPMLLEVRVYHCR